jgi:hypothetical protein
MFVLGTAFGTLHSPLDLVAPGGVLAVRSSVIAFASLVTSAPASAPSRVRSIEVYDRRRGLVL